MGIYRPDGDYHFIVPDDGTLQDGLDAARVFDQPSTMYYIGIRDGSHQGARAPENWEDFNQSVTIEALETVRGPDITDPDNYPVLGLANDQETVIRGLTCHEQSTNSGGSSAVIAHLSGSGIFRVIDCDVYDGDRAFNGFGSNVPLYELRNNRFHDCYSNGDNGHLVYLDQGYFGDAYDGTNANQAALVEGNYFYLTDEMHTRPSDATLGHMLKCAIPNAVIKYNYFAYLRSSEDFFTSAIVDLWCCGDQEFYGNGFYGAYPGTSTYTLFVYFHKRQDNLECVTCWTDDTTGVFAYNALWDDSSEAPHWGMVEYGDLDDCTRQASSVVVKNNVAQDAAFIFKDEVDDSGTSGYSDGDNDDTVAFDDTLLNLTNPPSSVAFDASQLDEGAVGSQYDHTASTESRGDTSGMGMYASGDTLVSRTLSEGGTDVSDSLDAEVTQGTAVPTGEWVKLDPTLTEAPENRPYSGTVAGNNGFIYFWGGAHLTHPANEVDRFDVANEVWDRVTTEESWRELEPIGAPIQAIDTTDLTIDILASDWDDQIDTGDTFWTGPVTFDGNPKSTNDGFQFILDSTENIAGDPDLVRLHVSETSESSLADVADDSDDHEVVIHPPDNLPAPWTHLTYKEKWNLIAAMHGGWQSDYVTPLDRPVTKHIYQQIVEHDGRLWLNNAGFFSWDISLGDSTDPNSWQRHAEPPIDEVDIHLWSLRKDPDLGRLVLFYAVNNLAVYTYDEGSDSWSERSLTGGSYDSTYSEVYAAYDTAEKKWLLFARDQWEMIDLTTNEVLSVTQPPFMSGWDGPGFSIEFAPEIGKFIVLASVDDEFQMWTYETATDTWAELSLDGTPPPDGTVCSWDRLERDPDTSKYVFLAYETGSESEVPDTYAFTLEADTSGISRTLRDALTPSDRLTSELTSVPPFSGIEATLAGAGVGIQDRLKEAQLTQPGGASPVGGGASEELVMVTQVFSMATSSGDQDFVTDRLDGLVPKAILLYGSKATSLGGEGLDELDHYGMADGTNQYAISSIEEDGSNYNDTDRSMVDDACLMYTSTHGPDFEVSFVSFLSTTDTGTQETGVRLNFDSAPGDAYLFTIVFLAGADLDVAVGATSIPTDGVGTVSPGFDADVTLLFSNARTSFGTGADGHLFSQGWVVNDGSSNGRTSCLISALPSGSGGSQQKQLLTSNYCVGELTEDQNDDTIQWLAVAENFTSTGFDLNASSFEGTPDGAYALWLAIRWGSFTVEQQIHDLLTTDSGLTDLGGYGIEPAAAMMIPSRIDDVGPVIESNTSSCEGWATVDGDETMYGYSTAVEDGDTGVGNTMVGAVLNYNHDGTQSFYATFDSYRSDGIRLDVSTSPSEDFKLPVLVFQKPTSEATDFEVTLSDGVTANDLDTRETQASRQVRDPGVEALDVRTVTSDLVRALADPGAGVSDAKDLVARLFRSMADAVEPDDAALRMGDLLRRLADEVGVDDRLERLEVTARVIDLILAEAVPVEDRMVRSKEFLALLLEDLDVSDRVEGPLDVTRLLADLGLSLSDQAVSARDLLRRLADHLPVTDRFFLELAPRFLPITLADDVPVSDRRRYARALARLMVETVDLSDRSTRLLAVYRMLDDAGVAPDDAVARAAEVDRLLADLVEVGDDLEILEKIVSILVSRVILADVTKLNIEVDIHRGDKE